MEVLVTPGARKLLRKLPKIPQIAIVRKLQKMQAIDSFNSTKLGGYRDVFRVRVGNYRIVYRIRNRRIYVFLVGHRKEVYKLLDRMLK